MLIRIRDRALPIPLSRLTCSAFWPLARVPARLARVRLWPDRAAAQLVLVLPDPARRVRRRSRPARRWCRSWDAFSDRSAAAVQPERAQPSAPARRACRRRSTRDDAPDGWPSAGARQ